MPIPAWRAILCRPQDLQAYRSRRFWSDNAECAVSQISTLHPMPAFALYFKCHNIFARQRIFSARIYCGIWNRGEYKMRKAGFL